MGEALLVRLLGSSWFSHTPFHNTGAYHADPALTMVNLSVDLCHDCTLCSAGSDNGAVTVWDLQTRQPIRILQKAGKGPVTGILVMDRPPFLAAGQGGRGDRGMGASSQGSSKKGPERPLPLAPFSKYQGSAGTAKPWEGLPVIIAVANPYRYCESCGMPMSVW